MFTALFVVKITSWIIHFGFFCGRILQERLQLSPVLGFVLPDNNASWRGRQDGDVTRKFPWLLRDIFAHRLHLSLLLCLV